MPWTVLVAIAVALGASPHWGFANEMTCLQECQRGQAAANRDYEEAVRDVKKQAWAGSVENGLRLLKEEHERAMKMHLDTYIECCKAARKEAEEIEKQKKNEAEAKAVADKTRREAEYQAQKAKQQAELEKIERLRKEADTRSKNNAADAAKGAMQNEATKSDKPSRIEPKDQQPRLDAQTDSQLRVALQKLNSLEDTFRTQVSEFKNAPYSDKFGGTRVLDGQYYVPEAWDKVVRTATAILEELQARTTRIQNTLQQSSRLSGAEATTNTNRPQSNTERRRGIGLDEVAKVLAEADKAIRQVPPASTAGAAVSKLVTASSESISSANTSAQGSAPKPTSKLTDYQQFYADTSEADAKATGKAITKRSADERVKALQPMGKRGANYISGPMARDIGNLLSQGDQPGTAANNFSSGGSGRGEPPSRVRPDNAVSSSGVEASGPEPAISPIPMPSPSPSSAFTPPPESNAENVGSKPLPWYRNPWPWESTPKATPSPTQPPQAEAKDMFTKSRNENGPAKWWRQP
jgi:hypothetical protein